MPEVAAAVRGASTTARATRVRTVAVLTDGGDASVKEGGIGAGWVKVAGGVKQLLLSGNRIGVLTHGGVASVKEGGLGAGWVVQHGGARSLVLSGNRIGAVTGVGVALVKEGALNAEWSSVWR